MGKKDGYTVTIKLLEAEAMLSLGILLIYPMKVIATVMCAALHKRLLCIASMLLCISSPYFI